MENETENIDASSLAAQVDENGNVSFSASEPAQTESTDNTESQNSTVVNEPVVKTEPTATVPEPQEDLSGLAQSIVTAANEEAEAFVNKSMPKLFISNLQEYDEELKQNVYVNPLNPKGPRIASLDEAKELLSEYDQRRDAELQASAKKLAANEDFQYAARGLDANAARVIKETEEFNKQFAGKITPEISAAMSKHLAKFPELAVRDNTGKVLGFERTALINAYQEAVTRPQSLEETVATRMKVNGSNESITDLEERINSNDPTVIPENMEEAIIALRKAGHSFNNLKPKMFN